jgi:hypothetical protein
MEIRPADAADHEAIWKILEPTIRAGETYTLPRDLTRDQALAYWHSPGREVFVAEENGEILGTYFLHANQKGGGAHVANCGYMTAPCAATLSTTPNLKASAPCSSTSSLAPTNAPSASGKASASLSSAACPQPFSIRNSASSMLW